MCIFIIGKAFFAIINTPTYVLYSIFAGYFIIKYFIFLISCSLNCTPNFNIIFISYDYQIPICIYSIDLNYIYIFIYHLFY